MGFASHQQLFLAAVAALTLAGCGISVQVGDDAHRRVEHRTVDAEGIATLVVSTENGAVAVRTGSGTEVAVDIRITETDEGDAEYRIDHDGDRLLIVGECDGGWFESCQVGFDVVAPPDLDVRVDTDNGRIEVDGMTGATDLESDNGAIVAQRLGGDEARARTDNGRIELTFAAAPTLVDASTDNGAIVVVVPDDGERYDVDAASDNGGVGVDVPTDAAADRTIVAESDNGAIAVGSSPRP